MFGLKSKNAEIILTAPANGIAVSLENVPDPVFSEKILGDGIAIIPSENEIAAPIDGIICEVTDSLHAIAIESTCGLEVLIHVGIDTVNLKGEGFLALVKKGDKVSRGDKIIKFDPKLIKSKGYDLHTPIIITNTDKTKAITPIEGDCICGKTEILKVKL